MKKVIALDIGNAFGKASILVNKAGDPWILLPEELGAGMPTDAFVAPDGSIEVYQVSKMRPNRAVRAVKTRFEEDYIELTEGEETYRVSPDKVYSAIAKELVSLANRALIEKYHEEPVYDVIITYPAYAVDNENLRNRFKRCVESIEIDGRSLTVCDMVTEPVAAAIDYLYYTRNILEANKPNEGHAALVYDLGHGTFDVAVVIATANADEPFKQISQDGDPSVGGLVFDKILYDELYRQVKEAVNEVPQSTVFSEELRRNAIQIKHWLSRNLEDTREIIIGGNIVSVSITRAWFEERLRNLLQRSFELVGEQMTYAPGGRIDCIILSGGCSEIPYIERALHERFGETLPIYKHRPNTAITFGAARHAYAKAEAKDVLHQFTEYAYGISLTGGRMLDEVLFVVDGGKKLPCVSKEITVESHSSIFDFTIMRSPARMEKAERMDADLCKFVARIPFEVPPSSPCSFTATMEEDHSFKVSCQYPDGTVCVKSSYDVWKDNK